MKPINIKKIGNKIVVTLCNGKTVESSILPAGIYAYLIKDICDAEGITYYPADGTHKGRFSCMINGKKFYIADKNYSTVSEVVEYIEELRIIIDEALIIHDNINI